MALLLLTVIAALIAYAELHTANMEGLKFPIPGIEKSHVQYPLLAFALAPIGEETLFRGLLLGYMLEKRISPWIAITVSAFLFSLTHIIPFSTAPMTQQVYVVGTAFVMSILAGYLRKRAKSLLPAITTHIGFNLGGFIITILA